MTSRTIIERVEGDIGPDLFTTVRNVDLTGVTSIEVIIRYDNGQSLTKPGIITDAPNGKFNIEWVAGDLINGDHKLEYRFLTGSQVATLPYGLPAILRVRKRV
jgi:hypothetical protein